jgi:hypothetical protein
LEAPHLALQIISRVDPDMTDLHWGYVCKDGSPEHRDLAQEAVTFSGNIEYTGGELYFKSGLLQDRLIC